MSAAPEDLAAPSEVDIREVGGTLVTSLAAQGRGTRFELLRRRSGGEISIRYRMSHDLLFWYRKGLKVADLRVDGQQFRKSLSATGDFTFIPAGALVEGHYKVDDDCEYAVISFDPNFVIDSLGARLNQVLSGSKQPALRHGVDWLSREIETVDGSVPVFLEGWAKQALAVSRRISTEENPNRAPFFGGLTANQLKMVKGYVEENLAEQVSLAKVAEVAGCSERHLLREFQRSVGVSPMKYIKSRRIERAKRLLSQEASSLEEIGHACGFRYVQHFITAFGEATGLTPYQYRRLFK
ncbi:helix-turn-helix domain-containing protein [Acidisoma sp. L85]|uniref:helix-turn-helix domain-containing protein n=1 Tax=Acidisoma sp. L85 TaxID=1641850 RepID=UPI00131C05B3|nr:AraC family transcriptional regulator [Acidisoma sp. L85]